VFLLKLALRQDVDTSVTPFAPLLEDVMEPYRTLFFNKSHLGFVCPADKMLAAFAFTAKVLFVLLFSCSSVLLFSCSLVLLFSRPLLFALCLLKLSH
jgi:hypothetical protein